MRVIAKSTLKKFWEQSAYADAQNALESWYEEARKAAWATPQDVKNLYASASVVGGNRVVFNICGNKYRLVVEMQYRAGIAWIKFIGTHKTVRRHLCHKGSTMTPIRPIKTDEDLQAAFARLEVVFQAADNTPEADEMEILVALIEAYENKHYPIYPPNPIAAIEFRMEQQGLTRRDLEPFIGTSGRVSEVMACKRPLSIRMVKRLHEGLQIPYESLLAGVRP